MRAHDLFSHRPYVILSVIAQLALFAIVPTVTHAATLTIQPDGSSGQDTWAEYLSSSNHGGEANMAVYASGGAGGHFSFIKFPLSSIPTGATINSATMSLNINNRYPSGSETLRLHRVTNSWDENSLIWDTMPSIDSSSTYIVDTTSSQSSGWLDIGVTSLVRDWYNGTISNYGVRLGFASFTTVDQYLFHTSESSESARPKLTVSYTLDENPSPSPTPSTDQQASPSPTATSTTSTTNTTTSNTSPSPTPHITSTPSPATTAPVSTTTKGSPSPSKKKTSSPSVSAAPSSSPELNSPSPSPLPPVKTLKDLPPPATLWQELRKGTVITPDITLTAITLIPSLVTATGSTVAALAINTLHALINLPSLLTQLWVHMLFLLGVRKRQPPWGRVLDGLTGKPITGVLVSIYSHNDSNGTNTLIEHTLSDDKGRFGFLVSQGNYFLQAKKAGYDFPSRLTRDAYAGHAFRIDTQRTIAMDLYLDPLSAVAQSSAFFNKVKFVIEKVRIAFLLFGTVLVGYSISQRVDIINLSLSIIYLGLWINEIFHLNTSRHTLTLVDKNKKPLPFTVFRLRQEKKDKAPVTKVTDKQGEAFILVASGDYSLTVPSPRHPDGVTQSVNFPHGIAPKNMTIVIDY